MSISDRKREFLKRSVQTLKKTRSLTQRRIAEEMGEDEGALSGKLGGSRIGDILTVGPDAIREGLLTHTQVKTSLVRRVPLIPSALTIIERYQGGKALLPVLEISGGDMQVARTILNRNLKVAAQAAGIDKPIATHWARHTFANWMADLDVREDVIAALMGHRAKSRTASYMAKQGDERSRKAMQLLESALQ